MLSGTSLLLRAKVLGSYNARNTGTSFAAAPEYTAAQSGFVVVTLYSDGDGERGWTNVYVDGTIRGRGYVHFYLASDVFAGDDTVTVPVANGSTCRIVVVSTAGTISATAHWIPLAP